MPWQLLRRPSGDINHRWDRLTPDISPNHFLAITCCFCHTSYHPEFPPFVTLVHLVIISETRIDHIVLELHLSDAINIEYVKFSTTCKKIEDTRKTHRIHHRRERSQPQIPLIGSIFDCIGARKELWKMSMIVRDQYHSTTKTKTQEVDDDVEVDVTSILQTPPWRRGR